MTKRELAGLLRAGAASFPDLASIRQQIRTEGVSLGNDASPATTLGAIYVCTQRAIDNGDVEKCKRWITIHSRFMKTFSKQFQGFNV